MIKNTPQETLLCMAQNTHGKPVAPKDYDERTIAEFKMFIAEARAEFEKYIAEAEEEACKMTKIEQAARQYAINLEGTYKDGSPVDHQSYDGFIAGAAYVLEKAKEMRFNVINDESPVVLISNLEELFKDKQCSPT